MFLRGLPRLSLRSFVCCDHWSLVVIVNAAAAAAAVEVIEIDVEGTRAAVLVMLAASAGLTMPATG